MSPSDDARIEAMTAAVERAPDDVELRKLLAESLLDAGRAEEAERQYKAALKRVAHDEELTRGWARSLAAQGRDTAAVSVLDAFAELGDAGPALQLEHARLLLAVDRTEDARKQYQRAITADPELSDPFLARRLGATPPRASVVGGRERAAVTTDGTVPEDEDDERVQAEKPRITFQNVGGMADLKEVIRLKIVHPLQNPELYKAYGKRIGGGILLYGPPGCGKTHLARATAGEVQATFLAVGIHDVLEMWIGQSERNLHAIFEQARRSNPAVLFFDEVDALGASRTDMRGASGRHVINQFLSELDGVESSNDGVLVLAATNAPWHLDNAFRRPGRFDRMIFVPPPDLEARARILEIHCLGRPTDDIDHERVARKTDGYSGADLEAILDLAIEARLGQAMKDGHPLPLRTKDLLAAAKKVKPSTVEWLATVRNYVLYANEGGMYDNVRAYLNIK